MSSQIRGLIYFIFLAGFLISAPLVVLYTAGYRYNFRAGGVVQTGILSLTSLPKGAIVSVDKKQQQDRTPSVLDNIIPGEHAIKIEKEGYTSWSKQLEINSRTTTFVREVVLFLLNDPTLFRAANIRVIAHEPNGTKSVYLAEGEEWIELWMLDPEDEEETLLLRIPASRVISSNISWSLNGTFVSAKIKTNKDNLFSIIDTRNLTSSSVFSLVPGVLTGYWDANNDDQFIVETNKGLVALSASTQQATRLGFEASAVISSQDELIIVETLQDRTVVSRKGEDASELIAYLPLGSYSIHPAASGTVMLEDAQRHRIILLNSIGGDQPILLNTEARFWSWEPGARRLLYSDGFDLHIYDAGEHTDETLTRVSDEILGVSWYSTGSTVVYSQQDSISAIELDRRSGRNVTKLVNGSGLSDFWMDENGKDLFFIGTINGVTGLYKKQLQR